MDQLSPGTQARGPVISVSLLLVVETLQKLIRSARDVIVHLVDQMEPCAVLQYADDTLILLRGDINGVAMLKSILDQFAAFTGLCINYNKSTAVPIHMEEDVVQQCVDILGCRRECFPQTYLGLPLSVAKLPASAYDPYIAKADRYLSTWQASLLNTMGRVVLVNSVLDSQLVYLMSSLPIPPGVIKQVDARRRLFMWGGTQGSTHAQCLVAWTNVCTTKDLGGLGTKDLGAQNICLLLKLIHRLHSAESSAWAHWVRQRASLSNLQGDLHGHHWEILRSLLPLYQAITSVAIGNGNNTSFWYDV
jgi:hypothetical protein